MTTGIADKATSLRETLNKAMELQAEVIQGIAAMLQATPDPDGVTKLPNETGLAISIVNSSTLAKSKSWDARHFMSRYQVDRILEAVKNKDTFEPIERYVAQILNSGFIPMPSNDRIRINKKVRSTLQEAYNLMQGITNGE